MNTIHKISTPLEGLRYLAGRYDVAVPADAKIQKDGLFSTLTAGGKTIALLPWRSERKFVELKNLTIDGTLKDISVLRSCHIDYDGTDMKKLLCRELDLAEWIFDAKLEYIFTMKNGKAANTVARLRNGIVCTLETAATLAPEAQTLDKHEIIASKGVALDKVVDTQIQQNSVYLYTDQPEPDAFTDTDFELYGLNAEDVALVRCALEALKDPAAAEKMNAQAARLEQLAELALRSAETGRKLIVED